LLDSGFLVFSCADRVLALPAGSVRTVMGWAHPKPLPRCAPWVEGVLVGQGEAVPVLREGHLWGVRSRTAEIIVVVLREGRALALLGKNPRMAPPGPLLPMEEDLDGLWSGTLADSSGAVPCLDLGKLYMALGLH
jgi:hypothetical protein